MPEPEDAIPAAYQPQAADPNAARRARLQRSRFENFRTSARIVGVHISDDGTELWSHGIGKPHHPTTGARCAYEEHGGTLVFEAPTYELPITVPKAARRYARKFAAEFNTWQKTGAHVPPKA